MPPTKTWKTAERRVAAFFNTLRQRLSGSSGRADETAADTKHERLFIEVKYRENHAVRTLYDEVALKAKREGKIPLVALVSKNKPGFLLVMHIEHLPAIASEACLTDPTASEGFTGEDE